MMITMSLNYSDDRHSVLQNGMNVVVGESKIEMRLSGTKKK